jgi:uncharacterized protein YjbJ (UPF0337 family)
MAKNAQELKGRAKRATGEMTGNERMKQKGSIDKAAGKTKKAVGKAADKAKDVV